MDMYRYEENEEGTFDIIENDSDIMLATVGSEEEAKALVSHLNR